MYTQLESVAFISPILFKINRSALLWIGQGRKEGKGRSERESRRKVRLGGRRIEVL